MTQATQWLITLILQVIKDAWEAYLNKKYPATDGASRKLEDVTADEIITLLEFVVRFVIKLFDIPFGAKSRGNIEIESLVADAKARFDEQYAGLPTTPD